VPRTEGKRNELVFTDVGGRILKLKFLKRGMNIFIFYWSLISV